MKKRQIIFLVLFVLSVFNICNAEETDLIPKQYRNYSVNQKIVQDEYANERSETRVLTDTISLIKFENTISNIKICKSKEIESIVREYLGTEDFAVKITEFPCEHSCCYKGCLINIKDEYTIKIYDLGLINKLSLYVLEYYGHTDAEVPIETGSIIVFTIKEKQINILIRENWKHSDSGEYTDSKLFGVIKSTNEVVIKKISVGGVRYLLNKIESGEKVLTTIYYDKNTTGYNVFNPD